MVWFLVKKLCCNVDEFSLLSYNNRRPEDFNIEYLFGLRAGTHNMPTSSGRRLLCALQPSGQKCKNFSVRPADVPVAYRLNMVKLFETFMSKIKITGCCFGAG